MKVQLLIGSVFQGTTLMFSIHAEYTCIYSHFLQPRELNLRELEVNKLTLYPDKLSMKVGTNLLSGPERSIQKSHICCPYLTLSQT
jgi:hypothetical protein